MTGLTNRFFPHYRIAIVLQQNKPVFLSVDLIYCLGHIQISLVTAKLLHMVGDGVVGNDRKKLVFV